MKKVTTFESQNEWLQKFRNYVPPDKRFDVVKHATKVLAIAEALKDHKGLALVLDGVKPVKRLPKGLIEKQVEGAYVAHFGRTGFYTDTSLIVFDCSHDAHKAFMDAWEGWYLSGRFMKGPQFHDGIGFDLALKQVQPPSVNLSGEHHKTQKPLKHSPLGAWFG